MKIIFLDVDGVLNNAETHGSEQHHQTWPDWGFTGLDRRLVPKLNTLVHATGASLVLSSTWRKHVPLDEMHARLVSAGMDPKIQLISRTPDFRGKRRFTEIQAWLDRRDPAEEKVEKFVILDDDSDADIPGHFVNTRNFYGLTDEDVEAAIKILGPK